MTEFSAQDPRRISARLKRSRQLLARPAAVSQNQPSPGRFLDDFDRRTLPCRAIQPIPHIRLHAAPQRFRTRAPGINTAQLRNHPAGVFHKRRVRDKRIGAGLLAQARMTPDLKGNSAVQFHAVETEGQKEP